MNYSGFFAVIGIGLIFLSLIFAGDTDVRTERKSRQSATVVFLTGVLFLAIAVLINGQ